MSRPNLQRDAFLAHAMHLVVVKRVWQTTGSIKVAASCRHGIYFVDGNLREAWRVVGGLTPICKACPLRRAWFCCVYICCSLALSSAACCRAQNSMVFTTICVTRYSRVYKTGSGFRPKPTKYTRYYRVNTCCFVSTHFYW